MTQELALPVIVAGRRVDPDGEALRFSYEGGYDVILPRPTVEDARRMMASDPVPLRRMSLDDITIFLEEVGKAWMDPGNRWRRTALEWGAHTTGYAPPTIEWDVNQLGVVLNRAKQYDFIETDLGDPGLLDEWTRVKAIYQRCWPKGIIAHVMVGNVPMAGLFTLYRSLASKNITIAKLPRRDVVTSLCFANCIHDADPSHPVTRALSTLYWDPGSEVEQVVVEGADVVSVWGRGPSVESIKRRLGYGTDLIEFGPKRSFALLLAGVRDWDRVGMRMAYDVITYDQEGCWSMQEAYVEGDVAPFTDALASWLDRYQETIPRRQLNVDGEAHIQRARMEAEASGWEVIAPQGTDWTVVVTDGPTRIMEHPLCRFVYVHPIAHMDEALSHIDRDVQTVSLEPWDRVWDAADKLTAAGADRVVQIGRMSRMRPGFIHDGFHPMRKMVRWVAVERGMEYKYRFMKSSPEKDEEEIYRQGVRLVH